MNEPLRPATYGESPKEAGFGPRVPWAAIVFGASAVAFAVGLYVWNEASKADALRTAMHRRFQEEVGSVAPTLRGFREQLERFVLEARGIDDGATWAKPGFSIDSLHERKGVYLRIAADDAGEVETLRAAALGMAPDAIGRCLGLSPVALRGFYERGRFLNEDFFEEVEATDDVMRLRVMEEQLRNHLRRDLPLLVSLAESDYFLLVLQRGATRHRDPVDFFLWDLRTEGGELLLRTRAEARGVLLTARIALPGAPYQKMPSISPRRTGAQDCSLASQVRAATGAPPLELESEVPEPEPPAEADAPAAAPLPAEPAAEGEPAEPAEPSAPAPER